MLELHVCQFRVLTNAASSDIRLPSVMVAGRFIYELFHFCPVCWHTEMNMFSQFISV